MPNSHLAFAYLLSSILFIFSIRGLASPETARRGNLLGILGMVIAVAATLFSPLVHEYLWVLAAILLGGILGTFPALKVKMTSLPQMVAAFNGLGGLSSVFIAVAEIISGADSYLETSLGLIIGALAFSGSEPSPLAEGFESGGFNRFNRTLLLVASEISRAQAKIMSRFLES